MEIALTRHPNLYEAMKRIQDKNYCIPEKQYKCSLCKDTGFIAIDAAENEYASGDLAGTLTAKIRKCTCTVERDMEIAIKHSNINLDEYRQKNFKTFRKDSPEAKEMYQLAKKFIDENLLAVGFFGQSGAGKTHICIAICNELAKNGISHKYFSYRADIQKLKSMQNDFNRVQEYNELLNSLKQAKVLYIDDLFKLSQTSKGDIDPREKQIIYDIINDRYINKRKLIISSEYKLGQLVDVDEATAGRIYEMMDTNGLKVTQNRRFMR